MNNTQEEKIYEQMLAMLADQFYHQLGDNIIIDRMELADILTEQTLHGIELGAAAERERILDVILEKKRLLDEARTLHLNEGRIMLAYDMDSRFYTLKHLHEALTPTQDKGEDVSSNNTV